MRQSFKPLVEAPPGNTYVWIPTPGGSTLWPLPSNWQDTTTGTTGQSAPGAGSTVIVDTPVSYVADFYGGGAAREVTFNGLVTLTGAYRFGYLTSVGNFELSGSLITRGMSADQAYLADATLDVRGTLKVTESFIVGGALSGNAVARVNRLVLAATPDGNSPVIGVNAACSLEVGHSGNAAAGALTVDRGATLVGTGAINSTLVDNGLVDVHRQMFMGAVIGTGTIRIEANSTATVASIGASGTIEFAGPGAVLTIDGAPGALGPGTAVVGFGLGNAILFQNTDIASVIRTSGAGVTTLTLLSASGQIEDKLTLPGAESSLDFELLPSNPAETGNVLLVALPAASPVPSAVAPDPVGQRFIWTGASGTAWGDSGNWHDVGQPGSAAVPRTLDTVTVRAVPDGFTLVTGSGDAASLSFYGNVVFDGDFDFGRLSNERGPNGPGAASLTLVGAASTIRVQQIQQSVYGYVAIRDGAVVQAATAEGGSYYLSNGGVLDAGFLQNVDLTLDAGSRVEVGGSTNGALGVLTIDAGATARNIITGGTVVDNGRLVTDGIAYADKIEGTGEILIRHGSLSVGSSLGDHVVRFIGPNATLQLYDAASTMSQQISGFAVGDTIEFQQMSIAESFLRYSQGPSGGVLELMSANGTMLDSFDIVGHHTITSFLLTQGGTTDVVSVLPSHIDHEVSPGTATGDVFVWSGPTRPGQWIDAASWKDVTTGLVASIAPGQHDTVDLDGGYVFNPFVTGAASIADLVVQFGGTLDGTFTVQTAELTGFSIVGLGSTLQIDQLTEFGGITYATALTIDRAHVMIGTADLSYTTELRDAGFLSANALSFADLRIDRTARAVVGAVSGSIDQLRAGALTVEAGATLQNGALLEAGLVNDGLVDVTIRAEVTGAVTGNGTFDVGNTAGPATLLLDGSTAASIHIDLVAEADIVFGRPAAPHGVIGGFAVGDTLTFSGLLDAARAVFEAAGPAGGKLVLEDQNSQALASVQMLGDYRGATFALSEAAGAATVMLTAPHGA